LTEEDLIKGCIQKNVNCQRMLFEQYAGILMTVCIRYSSTQAEAEDVMQEAFIRVFAYIHQYRFEGSFEGWLKRVVANTALRILQKKGIRFSELNEDVHDQHIANTEAWSQASEAEILKLISNLPTGYRTVFNMYVLEGYTHEEISAMLRINIGTSRSQLAKARKTLRQQIISQEKFRLHG
jgi:RNA polymerase sigma factor (sigma-70 family)